MLHALILAVLSMAGVVFAMVGAASAMIACWTRRHVIFGRLHAGDDRSGRTRAYAQVARGHPLAIVTFLTWTLTYKRNQTLSSAYNAEIAAPHDLALLRGASLFHGIADSNRVAIIRELTAGERRVVDLTQALGLAQGTVSAHLACLRDCGLVVGRPEARQMFNSIAHLELMELLAAAERLLALTGAAVELCPNYGTETLTNARTTIEEAAP